MATLEKRLLDLERSVPSSLPFKMIVRKIIDVAQCGLEGVRCTFKGREWRRADDESEDQFLDRVYEQVKCSAPMPQVSLHLD